MSALESALALAALGWRVLPIEPPLFDDEDRLIGCGCGRSDCESVAKHPCADLAPNGQHDSTSDEAVIRDWFEQYPDINIAVDLKASGLMALDVDHPDGREAATAKLLAAMAKLGDLPPTVEQVSGSGNGHLIYKRPDFPIRGVLEDITIRGANYVVVAPSRHKSGGYYEWEAGAGPTEIAVAELPANWLAALRKPDPVGDVGVPPADTEPDWLRAVPDAKRVADMRVHLSKEKGEQMGVDTAGTTWNVIRTCARGYAVRDPAAVMAALLEIYNPKCDPPYSEDALAERLAKAYDQAHSPEWGGCYEPRAAKIAAFYESVGLQIVPDLEPEAPVQGEPPTALYIDSTLETAEKRLGRSNRANDKYAANLLELVRKHEMIFDENELFIAVAVVIENGPRNMTDQQVLEKLAQCGNTDKLHEFIAKARDLKAAEEAAKAASEQAPADDAELRSRLECDDEGRPKASYLNLAMILEWAEELRGKIRYDVSTKTLSVNLPKFKRDQLENQLTVYIAKRWGMEAQPQAVERMMSMVAMTTGEFNSVKDYLESCVWDGTPRLDSWLVDYCAAQTEDLDGRDVSQFISKVGAMWMIGAVARGVADDDTGAKMDTVLILEGAQGTYKSSAFEVLGGQWYAGFKMQMDSKDASMVVGRRWICELAELASLVRTGSHDQKAFLTQRSDYYRPPYAREPRDVTRRAVFGGTVNPDKDGTVDYLQDESGDRRWWPVRVGAIDIAALRRDRDQLWAEALHRYRSAEMHPDRAHDTCPGERWWLLPEEQLDADKITALRHGDNPWTVRIMDWARRAINGVNGVKTDRWTLMEIAEGALEIQAKEYKKFEKKVSAAARAAGFISKRTRSRGQDVMIWRHPDLSVPTDLPQASAPN